MLSLTACVKTTIREIVSLEFVPRNFSSEIICLETVPLKRGIVAVYDGDGGMQEWLAVEQMVSEFDEVIEERLSHRTISGSSSSSSLDVDVDLTSESSVKTEL